MGTQSPCTIELPGQPMDCCISSTAPIVASGLVDGQILLHRYQAVADAPSSSDDAPSSSYSSTQVLCRSSKKGASCRAVSFSGDGQLLYAGFETGTILQVDAATGKVQARMTKAHAAGINRLLALVSGQQTDLLAAGDDSGGLIVWDTRTQAAAYTYSKHTDYISGLVQHAALAGGGSSSKQQHQDALLAVSGDGTLSVHDLRAGKVIARSESDADDELLSVAVVKRGKKVVCGSQSGVLALWSWGYWNDCSDRFPGHPESVDALVKFDEDTLITGSSDGALRVVNVLPNKLIGVVGQHADDMPVERLALAADKQVLASMSHDSCVQLWDLSILQDEEDEEDGEEEGDDGGGSSEWEEAGSDDEAAGTTHSKVAQRDRTGAAAAGQQHVGSGADGQASAQQQQQPQDKAAAQPPTAAAAAAGGDSDSDSDSDSDEEQPGSKKRRKREKTAMRRGNNKPKSGGNFFADLL